MVDGGSLICGQLIWSQMVMLQEWRTVTGDSIAVKRDPLVVGLEG